MKRLYTALFAVTVCICTCCSNSSGPEDIERESGRFTLTYPSDAVFGFDILNGEHTAVKADIDLQLSDCFFTGDRLDSLYLSANLAGRGGGITLEEGLIAPGGAYPNRRIITFSDPDGWPLPYFVRCRGDSNYAKVSFDSVRTTADTCRAYFGYVLNVDAYEREFLE